MLRKMEKFNDYMGYSAEEIQWGLLSDSFNHILSFEEQVNIMLRKMGMLGVVAVLACASGCTMCCHPYDNCGPVYNEASGRPYCSDARAGSILENRAAPVVPTGTEEVIETSPQGVSSATQRLPAIESEPRILSMTDRKAGQATDASKTQTARRPVKPADDNADSKVWRW
jgi:hypothetical protein